MEKYDYRRVIIDDVKDWIVNDTDIMENGYTLDDEDIYDWIYDEVFNNDSITGNGAYYYNTEEKCSEYRSLDHRPFRHRLRHRLPDLCDLVEGDARRR